jgi:hypothetical protein
MCNTVEVAKCKRAEKDGGEIVGDCCIIIIIYYLVLAFDLLVAILCYVMIMSENCMIEM